MQQRTNRRASTTRDTVAKDHAIIQHNLQVQIDTLHQRLSDVRAHLRVIESCMRGEVALLENEIERAGFVIVNECPDNFAEDSAD